jgi:hypothetical protein
VPLDIAGNTFVGVIGLAGLVVIIARRAALMIRATAVLTISIVFVIIMLEG